MEIFRKFLKKMVKTEDESKDDIVEVVDINKEKVLEMSVDKINIGNDSDSDVLVIDEQDEHEETKPEPIARPAKRKRKSTSLGEESQAPPAKTSRRNSMQNSSKKFEQVENELEAMFADLEQDIEEIEVKPKVEHIEDEEQPKAKVEVKKEVKKEPKEDKEPVKKPVKKKEKPPAKPRRKSTDTKKSKKDQQEIEKQSSKNDNLTEQEKLLSKFKGPFVRVEGTVEDPLWTSVINNTTDSLERNDEQPDLDQVTRVAGFGYTLTTLSKNYNPKNFDESWICVFCRQPSHYNGLGDLFGPYYIPISQWKKLNLPSPEKANKDLASSFILGGSDQAGAKAKRKLQQQKKKVDSPVKKTDQSEVWFHEDCVCWMPTVRLVGAQLLGLSEAIRMSQKAVCSQCQNRGSTLACNTIRCRETAHFACAQALDWAIDEETMSAKCAKCA